MDQTTIEGVLLTPLKQIYHPKGDVWHALKSSDTGFQGFAEAYFSTIHYQDIKIWKRHLKMTLNFVVPTGKIRIIIYDDRLDSKTKGNFFDVVLSIDNYKRITIPPGLWVAFSGIGEGLNLLLNIANLEHDPNEIERKDNLNDIDYTW